jgi:predicted DNA-binding transcriptional regulator
MYPNVPPSPTYDRDINRLIEEYKKAYKAILEAIVQLRDIPPYEDVFQRQASLLRQIEVILTQLDETNKQWCETMIAQAFQDGQAMAVLSAGLATTLAEAVQNVSFSMLSRQTVDTLIADTYNDLLSATKNTERRIKLIVRQVVGDVIRQRAIQQYGRVTMVRDIVQQLTKKGLSKRLDENGWVGIIDKAGRRWDLTRYVDMVVRTKLHQAHAEGVRVEGIQRGIDTAIISTHNAKDECQHFEGMIISLNGLTEGLLTYDELKASNKIFHPNCQHKLHLVKIENLPKNVLEKHEKKVASLKYPQLKKKLKPLSEVKPPKKEEVQTLQINTM